MTRQLLVGILACGGWVACTSAPVDCRRFETGSFIVRHRGAQQSFSFLINRRGTIQTETDQQTGDVSRLAIRWTSPCTYELRLLESTKHYEPELEALRRNSPLHVEILSFTDAYCIFRTHRTADDLAYTDTLWVNK